MWPILYRIQTVVILKQIGPYANVILDDIHHDDMVNVTEGYTPILP
jgi:hypothetical protein